MNPHEWRTFDDDKDGCRKYEPDRLERYQRGVLEQKYRARVGQALDSLRQNAELLCSKTPILKKPVKY